ncbi:hypothetical protein [Flavobacterium silvaticum]|uniref:Uncharacterized protein n=1 Tax=Flavobacterium silvaticum TaxID=1852020 RepID=A0A972FZY0_9FLAO|nr:hypothetical protein [Flavobacterium silvaticum]NMH27876.1 hypothetical protein [Flavobacterium silvaticum]
MRFLLLSAISILTLFSCSPKGEIRTVPGCKCEMYVPDGLKEVKAFFGFQHPTAGVAIKVSKQRGAFYGLSHAIDAKVLKASGMTLIKKEKVKDSDQAMYFYLSQESGGVTYLQHMVLIGDNDNTYIFNAIFPQKLAKDWSDELKKAVLSASCKDLEHLEEPPPVKQRPVVNSPDGSG